MKDTTIGTLLMILTIAGLLGFMKSAQALEFYSYKDAVSTVEMSTSELESLWAKTAVCIKDGAKIKAVNKLFKDASLGYRDCSNSKNTKQKHKKLGISVVVVPLHTLDAEIVKKLN